jgi:hypothetical protein
MSTRENRQSELPIDLLKKRFEMLNETRIKVQTERDNALRQLKQLKESAVEQFGTDDPDQLRAQLAELLQQNENRKAEYEQSLDAIESNLREIDSESEQGEAE